MKCSHYFSYNSSMFSYTLECNYNCGRMVNSLPPAIGDAGRATPPPLAGTPPKYTPAHYEEVWSIYFYSQHFCREEEEKWRIGREGPISACDAFNRRGSHSDWAEGCPWHRADCIVALSVLPQLVFNSPARKGWNEDSFMRVLWQASEASVLPLCHSALTSFLLGVSVSYQ